MQDYTRPYRTIQDNKGLNRSIQNYPGLNSANRVYAGLFGGKRGQYKPMQGYTEVCRANQD